MSPARSGGAFFEMNFDQVNNTIRSKTAHLKSRLKKSISSQGMKHVATMKNPEPLTNISTRFSQQFGVINRIRIKFKRSGVMVHKGVGRGTKAGEVGSGKRTPKPWFNPVVEEFVEELSNAVADEMVDLTFNSIIIK
jgi:hypothetical protein